MWQVSVLVAVTCVLLGAVASADKEVPCTRVNQGQLCGEVKESREGRKYASYKGIPYAKPPIGELRFKNPVPNDNWPNTLQAVKDSPSCMQKNYLIATPFVEGKEDCLYLNVYTPAITTLNDNIRPKYPVMVYIHGGGFFSGSGNSSLHGPEYFMDQDVILVTFNYRLGLFGFLSTLDDAAPGNWAMRDMTLVLKWVQNNIRSFGGREDSVTIFGQSAGASSVHYLMLSPETKGLFHKAIAQSGTALNLFATPLDSLMVARAQALFVGCPINVTSEEMIECLRAVDAVTLLETGENFKIWSTDPLTIYIPSIEKKTEKNPNPFLTDMPLNLISKGEFHRVPFVLGLVENEGIIRVAAITTQSKLTEDLNNRWNELGPQILGVALSVPKNLTLIPALWQNITNFYNTHSININDESSIQNFLNFYSDRSFNYGIYQTATKHAKLNLQPVYFYKFNYAGQQSWSSVFAGNSDTKVNFKYNKCHCDDLNFFFRIKDFFPEPIQKDTPDYELSKALIKMWTNFARDRKPLKSWRRLCPGKFQYLDILGPKNMIMKNDVFAERMKFWESLEIEENR